MTAGQIVTFIVALIGSGTGTGGLLAFAKFFRERKKDKLTTDHAALDNEQAEIDITRSLRALAAEAVDGVRAEMTRLREDHATRILQLETQHDNEKRVWTIERENLTGEIEMLKSALRTADIPIPTFARRTA